MRNFPIDVLKVDKSFIDDIATSSERANLARGIIELGRTMHLDIVAEGIEDPLQVVELLRLHCNMGQGFHFARPLPADELGRYLQAQHGTKSRNHGSSLCNRRWVRGTLGPCNRAS